MTAAAGTVRVWDRAVRVLHWTLVPAMALSWLTGHALLPVGWHEPLGYAALAVVALRLAWGGLGSRHARFAQFVRSPRTTLGYARRVLARSEPRHVGHNPLGGWMVLALLAQVAAVGFTGWLFTTDRYWGDPGVEALHRALAWVLLGFVALHVAGVVHTSRRHHENLVLAMLTGRKRAPAPGDWD